MRLRRLLNPLFVYEKRSRIIPFARTKLRAWALDRRARGIPFTPGRRRLDDKFRQLAGLKDRFKGQRCFIVGNGPSLRTSDLDSIAGEVSIASNKIYLTFDRTSWRPSYLTLSDLHIAKNNCDVINRLDLPKIVDLQLRPIFDDSDNFLYYRAGDAGYYDLAPFRFSENFGRIAFGGYSVTYINLQLAHFLGCREIYLLGVDFHFLIPDTKFYDADFGELLVSQGERNHFSEDYRARGEIWTLPRLDLQELAFREARTFFDARRIKVMNASRQTQLEVFQRVEFESLFETREDERP